MLNSIDVNVESFLSKISFGFGEDACWTWMASTRNGYGRMRLSEQNRTVTAHRFSWEIYNEEIPEGMLVCHHCDNPPCVNPNHLFLGTQVDNVQDMIEKGRGSDNSGEMNGRAKLSRKDIDRIRELYKTTDTSYWELSMWFGVGETQIGRIIRGEHWTNCFIGE